MKESLVSFSFPIKTSQQQSFIFFFLRFADKMNVNFSDVFPINTPQPCLGRDGKTSLLTR